MKQPWCLTAILICLVFSPSVASAQSEEKAVIAAVQSFFDAMAEHDTSAARAVLMPEGQLFSVRGKGEDVIVRTTKHLVFLQQFAGMNEDLLERMWNPQVLIHRRIATLWTEYDFHRNGKFSHCGVDSFSLIKTDEGWKIVGAVYTVERTGCKESPLGLPK